MGYAEYRVRISTSKERSVRGEREEHYALTSGAAGCHEPRADQASVGIAGSILTGGRRPCRRATGKDDGG